MISQHRLRLSFDPARLKADLEVLWGDAWIAHFNTSYYRGRWTGIALRGVPHRTGTLFSDGDAGTFVDAPALARCSYLSEVVEAFRCEKRSVRLLRLDPGASIREHRDYGLGPQHGHVRVHIPIVTNPQVEFFVRNRRAVMAEGETWYLDLGQPHKVFNGGAEPRVHLVLDLEVNDWLRAEIPLHMPVEAGPKRVLGFNAHPCPEALAALDAFRDRVCDTPALQVELVQIEDRDLFVEETVRIGAEHQFRFTHIEVEARLMSENARWNAAGRAN